MFLQALLACAFRPNITCKYLYYIEVEKGGSFRAQFPRFSISFFPPMNKKCRVFYPILSFFLFFLKGVPFLFLFIFVPCRCALQAVDLWWRVEPAALQDRGHPAVVLLVLVKRWAGEMANHFTVRGRWSFHPAVASVAGGADARVAAGRARPSVDWVVYQVTVEDGSVGRGSDRLPVEFHLLLWVPELQCAGALVRRGLFSVRQGDGGRQVDFVLHVRVRRLEPVETVSLQEGRDGEPVCGSRCVDLLLEWKDMALESSYLVLYVLDVSIACLLTAVLKAAYDRFKICLKIVWILTEPPVDWTPSPRVPTAPCGSWVTRTQKALAVEWDTVVCLSLRSSHLLQLPLCCWVPEPQQVSEEIIPAWKWLLKHPDTQVLHPHCCCCSHSIWPLLSKVSCAS